MDQRLIDAILSIQEGNQARAFGLLQAMLVEDPKNVDAWLWMAEAVDDPQQKKDCLQRVLGLDPENSAARANLDRLEPGGTPAGEASAPSPAEAPAFADPPPPVVPLPAAETSAIGAAAFESPVFATGVIEVEPALPDLLVDGAEWVYPPASDEPEAGMDSAGLAGVPALESVPTLAGVPALSGLPILAEEPTFVEEPGFAEQFAFADQPALAGETAFAEQPALAGEPASTGAFSLVDEPVLVPAQEPELEALSRKAKAAAPKKKKSNTGLILLIVFLALLLFCCLLPIAGYIFYNYASFQ